MRSDMQTRRFGSSSYLDFVTRIARLLSEWTRDIAQPLHKMKSCRSTRLMKKKYLPTEHTLVLRQSVHGRTDRDSTMYGTQQTQPTRETAIRSI
jgi:hypothetical protein